MRTFSGDLKAMYPEAALSVLDMDFHLRGGEWVTPCMCGHDSHGYSGHCEHMSCDTDGCECGGYERQPGCARPTVRVEGLSPFMRMLMQGMGARELAAIAPRRSGSPSGKDEMWLLLAAVFSWREVGS